MTAERLVADLRAAGLVVKLLPGWDTRGGSWRYRSPARAVSAWMVNRPVTVLHHHTAPPVPYPPYRLITNGLIKANMNTKPDGTVWMIAYKACNYSSGPGSATVLGDVMAGREITANALTRGLRDDINTNPYYWNFENDHPGDGSALPAVQFNAIVTATQVVNSYFGIDAFPISHAESTRRKIDPRWNGSNRTAIEQIRAAVAGPPPTKVDYMFPISRGDGSSSQRPERKQDIQFYQIKLKEDFEISGGGQDGVADQGFLDAIFQVVGSPAGGSYFSGREGAIFDREHVKVLADASGVSAARAKKIAEGVVASSRVVPADE